MKKYGIEEIEKIIGDIRVSANLTCKDPDRLCTSAEELKSNLVELKKYIIPEKREEWCDLISAIMYDVTPIIPPIMGSETNMQSKIVEVIPAHIEKLAKEIFRYICVGEIMESFDKNGLEGAVQTLNDRELVDWERVDIIYDIMRFSTFGPEFVDKVSPELVRKNRFKHEYDKAREYLNKRRELEGRLEYSLKIKKSLEEYKKYCVEYYFWPYDNTEEKLTDRKDRLARTGDEYLYTIVNNTYLFARYLIGEMKNQNHVFQDRIFVSITYQEDDAINLGCAGGHFADSLYQVECGVESIWISRYVLSSILDELSIEEDYDVEDSYDDDEGIGCIYTYPKLTFDMKLDSFNKYYEEFFENRARSMI